MNEPESPKPEPMPTETLELDPGMKGYLFAGLACESLDMAAQYARNVSEGAHALVVEAFLRYMQARGCFDEPDAPAKVGRK
jgi:hypothetical protein